MTAVIGANTVHPRMRARRQEVERDKVRRRRRILVAMGVAMAVASAAVIFLQSSFVEVDSVDVTGTLNTPVEAVLEAAGVQQGESLLTLDLTEARESVADLPWVDEVWASADWSGKVRFEVSERVPVAQVASPSGFSVVDSEGRVVSFANEPWPDLVVVSGVTGAGAGGWLARDALPAVEAAAAVGVDLEPFIQSVTRDPDGRLFLDLASGGRVLLGDTRQLHEKMVAVKTLVDQVDMDCVGIVDVRAATAPVITRTC